MLDYLTFCYRLISASEPLLEDAIERLSDEGFEGKLKAFYVHHLEEERNHAKWLLEDIGDHPLPLHPAACTMAGTQYYLVRHIHPVCLMGYMMALEGNRISPEWIDQIDKELGRQASRTVRLHAEEDPKHIKELEEFPIPAELQWMVDFSKNQTLLFMSHLNHAKKP